MCTLFYASSLHGSSLISIMYPPTARSVYKAAAGVVVIINEGSRRRTELSAVETFKVKREGMSAIPLQVVGGERGCWMGASICDSRIDMITLLCKTFDRSVVSLNLRHSGTGPERPHNKNGTQYPQQTLTLLVHAPAATDQSTHLTISSNSGKATILIRAGIFPS